MNTSDEIVKAGTILYHGTKSGDLKIDFEKDNYLFFTPSIEMARDYALFKSDGWNDYLIQRTKSNIQKRKVIKVKVLKDLKILYYDDDLTTTSCRWMYIKDAKNKGYDGVAMEEKGYVNSKYIDPKTIDHIDGKWAHFKNKCVPEKYNKVINDRKGICEGKSYYFFDLHNIEVVGTEESALFESIIQLCN